MGYVTILVQHSWSMQPNGAESSSIGPSTDPKNSSPTQLQRSSPQTVRLTDPSSIQSFINGYNHLKDKGPICKMEKDMRDVLDRLGRLTLQSTIPDLNRLDSIRLSMTSKSSSSAMPKNRQIDAQRTAEKSSGNVEKARLYASQGRISLVLFSRSKSGHFRNQSLAILLEALDTNALSSSKEETGLLIQLLRESRKTLERMVDGARNRRSLATDSNEDVDIRVVVDHHMESLLKVCHLY